MDRIHHTFDINGFSIEAQYERLFVEQTMLPLLHLWTKLYQEKQRRILVFLAAPPAAGKSVMAEFFAYLSRQDETMEEVQALGMDGFHHYQSYILSHDVYVDGLMVPMKSVKGCPESFDFVRLEKLLSEISQRDRTWPIYNRKIHDVEDDKIMVDKNIVLIEGNYLELNEEPWKHLVDLCDYTMFIETEAEHVKQRLLHRKMMGGSLPHEAVAFYEQSEKRNVERILHHRMPCDMSIYFDGKRYVQVTPFLYMVEHADAKETITRSILKQLPAWFGIPEAIEEYAQDARNLPFVVVEKGKNKIGFAALKETSSATLEIYVTGILEMYHHQGIGRMMFTYIEDYAIQHGYTYLQVKTLDASINNPAYEKTRAFYHAVGFCDVECFPQLWDEQTPCLLMIKKITLD